MSSYLHEKNIAAHTGSTVISESKDTKVAQGIHNSHATLTDAATAAIVNDSNITDSAINTLSSEKSTTTSKTPSNSPLEVFQWRYLIGGWVIAATLAFASTYFSLFKPYMGLIFVLVGGFGTYFALTKESKYIRYSKRVLGFGLGLAGLLNALPKFLISFSGKAQAEHGLVEFLGKFTLDENPIYTILLLVLSFGFSMLLAYLAYKEDTVK